MRRDIFTEEHEMFRAQVRRFVETELVPKIEGWNRAGISDRESWRKLGAAGFLGPNAPAEYGGGGVDFIYDAIVIEEMARGAPTRMRRGPLAEYEVDVPFSSVSIQR